MFFRALFLILICSKCANCANILFLGTVVSPSHYIWNKALAFGLLEKGHEITMVSPDADKGPVPNNYKRIILEGIYDNVTAEDDGSDFFYNDLAKLGTYDAMKMFYHWAAEKCEHSLHTKGANEIINYPKDKHFDLIIIDITAGPCFYPLIKKFNYPPTIAVTAFLLPGYASFAFGNSLQASFIPMYALPYSTEMSFWERANNFFFTYLDAYHWRRVYDQHNEFYRRFGDDIPPFTELEKHISFLLANSDPILDYPQPVPPNMVLVGGLHTRPGKTLPEDIRALADKSTNGIVLFSLGTNLRSDQLKPETKKAFLTAFGRLKETVIWKFESEMKGLPKNVLIMKWLPQNDILGHPNIRVFMGHGGTLSTQEAIYHGVPLVVVPHFVDQYVHARIIREKEIGESLDVKTMTSDDIYNTIRKVIDNKKYKINAAQKSAIFKDRMETPLQRGVFWVEYVLRHGGAEFLNTRIRHMSFIAGENLDVIAVALIVFLVLLVIVVKIVKIALCVLKGKPKVKTN